MASTYRDALTEEANNSPTLVVSIGSSQYLVPPACAASVETLHLITGDIDAHFEQRTTPVTIIDVNRCDLISSSWLEAQLQTMKEDDVFCEEFLSFLFLQSNLRDTRPRLDDDVEVMLKTWGVPAKLYSDPQGAFMCGVAQAEDHPMSYGRIYGRISSALIPVPPRSYSGPPLFMKPLVGKRVAVKDIYNICGLKNSMGSKAYYACYGKCDKTAGAIQKLLRLGAVVVGQTKTVQLASGLGPRDWIDYQCPFNPRGDGYLDPDCSSTGSAVGVAAYDWVDFSVGSDSLGSMTGPAAANGIFGLRPTQGRLPLDGSLLVSTLLDTPGVFSRNITEFGIFAKAWLGYHPLDYPSTPPTKILYPVERFFPYSRAKLEVMESFIRDLEKTAGIQRTVFNIDSLWSENLPSNELKSVDNFLATTVAHIQLHDSCHNNATFRQDYKAKFGSEPYVEPMIKYKWDLGAKLTKRDYDEACNEKAVFQKFLSDFVFTKGTVMLLPGGDPETSYRDDYMGSPDEFGMKFQGFGFKNTTYSILGGLPCVSFPVGQSSYHSKISNREEFEPVSLMLLGPPKSDLVLIDLIKGVLESSGRPLSVKVGKTAF